MGRVTLQTVADTVGVSRMTVSNAFSRPDQLSEALRVRILAAADELGYCGPDPAARALVRGTAGSVGVLMTDPLSHAFTDQVATGFLGAVTEQLAPTGLALTLLSSGTAGTLVPARDVPLDGVLIYSCDLDSAAVDFLSRRGIPLVFVDQTPVRGQPSVNVDDRSGARAAAQHLVDLGHRRVGIVVADRTGPHGVVLDAEHGTGDASGVHVTRQRMLGWTDALDAAGIAPLVVKETLDTEDSAYRAGQALLDHDEPPTAILCWSDVMAHWVVRAAEDHGIDVPGQLSVVGFDDSPFSRAMRPALTTVRQDVAGKGRAAAAALVSAIERARDGRAAPRPRHLVLPTELVVRDSTAAAPRPRPA